MLFTVDWGYYTPGQHEYLLDRWVRKSKGPDATIKSFYGLGGVVQHRMFPRSTRAPDGLWWAVRDTETAESAADDALDQIAAVLSRCEGFADRDTLLAAIGTSRWGWRQDAGIVLAEAGPSDELDALLDAYLAGTKERALPSARRNIEWIQGFAEQSAQTTG
ncbi:hypothetical protein O4215_20160 [Rhodococcus maanshanensis]|uniref:hypothetical protein n=1 Tax=Rhodococcus maanshanensis TaxID=183556 RepID=UPI0022B3C583|nr:hypothetical protein [Rhodococcus maanshanensis]MCZ4557882.1 hypothetical protein [Rhodococcus maanshanensis]